MKTIREYLNLLEAPVDDFQLHGDFTKNGTLVLKDRELVSKPKHELRIRKLLNRTPFKINVNIWNHSTEPGNHLHIKNTTNYLSPANLINSSQYIGQYSLAQVKDKLKLEIKYDYSAITFILAGNDRGEDTLSAWMIVHRFMHAIEDACDGITADDEVMYAYEYFQDLISEFGTGNFRDQLLTTKSAANMTSSIEVFAELMTQYLVKGKVVLANALNKDAIVRFEKKINDSLEALFKACVGKIFVIF